MTETATPYRIPDTAAIREIVRSLAARPDGVSITDLATLLGEQQASDAVTYLLTSGAVEGHRVDDGPWRYSAVPVRTEVT